MIIYLLSITKWRVYKDIIINHVMSTATTWSVIINVNPLQQGSYKCIEETIITAPIIMYHWVPDRLSNMWSMMYLSTCSRDSPTLLPWRWHSWSEVFNLATLACNNNCWSCDSSGLVDFSLTCIKLMESCDQILLHNLLLHEN